MEALSANGGDLFFQICSPYGSLWFLVNHVTLMPNTKTTEKSNSKSASSHIDYGTRNCSIYLYTTIDKKKKKSL